MTRRKFIGLFARRSAVVGAGLLAILLATGDSGDTRWLLTTSGLVAFGVFTLGLGLYFAAAEVALGMHREPELAALDPRREEWNAMLARRRNGHGRTGDRAGRRR